MSEYENFSEQAEQEACYRYCGDDSISPWERAAFEKGALWAFEILNEDTTGKFDHPNYNRRVEER